MHLSRPISTVRTCLFFRQCERAYYVRRHVHRLSVCEFVERSDALLERYRHLWALWPVGADHLSLCGLEDVGTAPAHGARLYDGANWWSGEPPFRAEREAGCRQADREVPAEARSAEARSAEARSAEGGSAEGGSAEGGSAEARSAEGGSAEGRSAEGVVRKWCSMQYALPLRMLSEALARLTRLAAERSARVSSTPTRRFLDGRHLELKFVGGSERRTLLGVNRLGGVMVCFNLNLPLTPEELEDVEALEAELRDELRAIPHLGKHWTMLPAGQGNGGLKAADKRPAADSSERKGGLTDTELRAFAKLRLQLDPDGLFYNEALESLLGPRDL